MIVDLLASTAFLFVGIAAVGAAAVFSGRGVVSVIDAVLVFSLWVLAGLGARELDFDNVAHGVKVVSTQPAGAISDVDVNESVVASTTTLTTTIGRFQVNGSVVMPDGTELSLQTRQRDDRQRLYLCWSDDCRRVVSGGLQ